MKILYGISNYKTVKEEGYYYVDKTMYLEKLEKCCSYIIYKRPRRFGKTLFTSMMYYYYDINSSDKFDTLFKNTYIHNNPTPNKNNYYVLKFDFSGLSNNNGTIEDIENKFKDRVIEGINIFKKYYKIFFELNTNKDAATIFSSFVSQIDLDNKIYIIIDEYDNFTNSIISSNHDLFRQILGDNGFVKDFYARIKEYCGLGIVDRVFITGVCSISLDSMTSGFNIAKNITNNHKFNSMTALTHDEVKILLSNFDNKNEIFDEMLENYDGYRFDEESELVFNPTLTMYYLDRLINDGRKPKRLLDSNIISNYEQIKNIIKLGNAREILMDIFDNGEISANLIVNFDIARRFSKDEIVSLLFYFGYLTINRNDYVGLVFNVPNKVIESVFNMYFLEMLRESNIEIKPAAIPLTLDDGLRLSLI